jgi:hypothetical protein
MKAWKLLAVVLASLAFQGCVSKEKPAQPAAAERPAERDPSAEQRAIVAHLLDAHQEAVGQMRVSIALRSQHNTECN